jgi:hypothetical protein
VTLKEAEAATDIPSNTIRKWIRRDTVDSYLESDGQMALRMVDLDSLLARAKELGRPVVERETTDNRQQTTDREAETTTDHGPRTTDSEAEAGMTTDKRPEGTMLVPIDAWNKMLNQLGNLHEAGQQLAEARERAAKAETEATFLRERLSEMRQKTTDHRPQTTDPEPMAAVVEDPEMPEFNETPKQPTTDDGRRTTEPESDPSVPLSRGTGESASQGDEAGAGDVSEALVETTTYWRYLTTGWRDRKRRSRG